MLLRHNTAPIFWYSTLASINILLDECDQFPGHTLQILLWVWTLSIQKLKKGNRQQIIPDRWLPLIVLFDIWSLFKKFLLWHHSKEPFSDPVSTFVFLSVAELCILNLERWGTHWLHCPIWVTPWRSKANILPLFISKLPNHNTGQYHSPVTTVWLKNPNMQLFHIYVKISLFPSNRYFFLSGYWKHCNTVNLWTPKRRGDMILVMN